MKFEFEIDDSLLGALAASIADQLAADPEKREALAVFAVEQVEAGWPDARPTSR